MNTGLGNYLPDSHPYEDYREFYASDQSLGGAAVDVLLHELGANFTGGWERALTFRLA